jgi:hypothetical protein
MTVEAALLVSGVIEERRTWIMAQGTLYHIGSACSGHCTEHYINSLKCRAQLEYRT